MNAASANGKKTSPSMGASIPSAPATIAKWFVERTQRRAHATRRALPRVSLPSTMIRINRYEIHT
jgi:hypothetical protein